MKKEKKKKYMSMYGYVFSHMLIITALSLFLLGTGIILSGQYFIREEMLGRIRKEAVWIAERAAHYDMHIQSKAHTLDSDIDEIGRTLDGRILVVDHEYRIRKDSFVFKQGDYAVSEMIMQVMLGESNAIERFRDGFAEIVVPIKKGDSGNLGVVVVTASAKTQEKQMLQLRLVICLVGAIIFIVAIFLAWGSGKKSVRDLRRLNTQIFNISNGNINSKLPEQGFREVRYLAKNYNSVLEQLSTVDKSRQEFVSNVSHELKTPITSMKVLAESLLQNENASAEDYKEFMSDIVAEIDRETKIINDLLLLVKNDRADAKMNFADTDINKLIDVIMKRVTPLAEKRGIELIYESFREIHAEVDEVKLALVISNLVENAIKYNVDNGWVKVSLNADHKYFYFKCADSGVGIPDDAKDRVYERFYRVDKARSRDTGGTGLGLAIARSAVSAHGGIIRLYSESGKGTTFTVRIPLTQEKLTDENDGDVAVVKDDSIGKDKRKKNKDEKKQ